MTSNPISNSSEPVAPKNVPMAPKNAAGNRSDIGWKHCISIGGDVRKLQCKYCQKVITGGVYRLKHHLAGTQKDFGACKGVTNEVKKEMWEIVVGLQQKLIKKSSVNKEEESAEVADKRKSNEAADTFRNMFKKRGVSTQATINSIFKRSMRDDACQAIARFFYNNAIPFNVARTEEFGVMFAKSLE